jgi:hypothetical protein
VHLEALKAGLKGLPRRSHATPLQRLLSLATTVVGFIVLSAVVYYGIGWVKQLLPTARSTSSGRHCWPPTWA